MYSNDFLGVGIVTCNRKDSFMRLFDEVHRNDIVDYISVVKNKEFDYGDYEPSLLANGSLKTTVQNVKEDVGVGYCKNICLKQLIEKKCQHIFLIEDDVDIVDSNVFKAFIDTAKTFNVGHMNWNTIPTVDNNPTYTICVNDNAAVDISFRLCGSFSYFTYDALQYCGLINDKQFVNALEHVEHAYRMSLMKFAPPFYAFPCITNCSAYLKDCGEQSTIDHSSDLYKHRLATAYSTFKHMYGRTLAELPIPTVDEVKQYFVSQMQCRH